MMFQKALQKKRDGEGGFTLIELLVVMVIIGLLAAIAIPLFLSQKDKARESAMKSDLRNIATAAETFAVDNNGSYVGATVAALSAAGYDFKSTTGVTVANAPTAPTAAAFCFSATHANLTGTTYVYKSNPGAGIPQLGKVGVAGVTACA